MINIRPRICLFEPRIPQNTGNISRSCAAFKLALDLIEPLGFSLEDKYLKRAGLDYWPYVDISIHKSFADYKSTAKNCRLIGFSKFANHSLTGFKFNPSDKLIFGREDKGLPASIKSDCNHLLSIPMPGGESKNIKGGVRSLNLSVSCGIVMYKCCEQLNLF